jgi:hypothetical protein
MTPFNLQQWIEDNRAPSAGRSPTTTFTSTPGTRSSTQLKGDIRVDVMENGRRKQHLVREGDVLLVPAGVPHSPLQPVGIDDNKTTLPNLWSSGPTSW